MNNIIGITNPKNLIKNCGIIKNTPVLPILNINSSSSIIYPKYINNANIRIDIKFIIIMAK
jgi:hypothetical protein